MVFKEVSNLTLEEKDLILNRASSIDTNLVKDIIEDVRKRGDEALRVYTQRFDHASVKNLRVSEEEFIEARSIADPRTVRRIEEAHANILSYHKRQVETEWWAEENGRTLGQLIRPVGSVGCYVPGGRAFYPSSVLMAATPARVAGVKRIAVTTPPRGDGRINEYTLVACSISGVDEVYKVGGAQAISALAYGTESIQKVDLIVGPGNVYVSSAKKAVYGDVGIDMIAGPSEVLIISDDSGNADYIVSDILAQAEHDPRSSCVLVTTSPSLGGEVKNKLDGIKEAAPPAIGNVAILIAKDLDEAVRFSNEYAPEHLLILLSKEEKILDKIKNAGSIFLGQYSPVAAGDYASGPNHILPTGRCARFQSGLNVDHFVKKISVQRISKNGLDKLGDIITTLAEAEGLIYHSKSVKKRL